jgi:hypothetical protein
LITLANLEKKKSNLCFQGAYQGDPSQLNQPLDDEKSNGVLALNENQAPPPKRQNSKKCLNLTKRDEMTDRQQREANLGTILVGISLLFIVCQSIKIVPDVSNIKSTK